MSTNMRCLVTAAFTLALSSLVVADENNHRYATGEPIPLWLNKVGPYHNPLETYSYYSLPFCHPNKHLEPHHKFAGLSEVMDGIEFVNSDLEVFFGHDIKSTTLCYVELNEATAEEFADAVMNHYWYQLYIDDLPVWGMVGEIEGADGKLPATQDIGDEVPHHLYIHSHKHLSIAYNGDRIVEVNLTASAPQEIMPNVKFPMSYSVEWIKSGAPFSQRFHRYLDEHFFEHHIHWFSIFNSFMMVAFLVGVVALILVRTLRNDYSKFLRDEESMESLRGGPAEDVGWKNVSGDVFRRAPHTQLLAALLGTGYQLAALVFATIIAAFAGSLYVDRGAVAKAFVGIFAMTAILAGYKSGYYYKSQFRGTVAPYWKRVMLYTAGGLPGVTFSMMMGLNAISIYYNTINTIPFHLIAAALLGWLVISLPLVVIGTIFGRRAATAHQVPSKIAPVPRIIPERPWYLSSIMVSLVAALLPFGSIFIEMYFVFRSFWNYKFYYVYGFMLLVFVILVIVTSCVTIVSTYFLLAAEDYRWQWNAFMSGACTAVYVFLYALYFFLFKTRMHGMLQTLYYFGYMSLFSGGLGLLCGAVGHVAGSWFVYKIYSEAKAD